MTTDEFSAELQELIAKGMRGGLKVDEIETELEAAIETLDDEEHSEED